MTTLAKPRNRAICSTSWKPMESLQKKPGKWVVILFALSEGDVPVAVRYVPDRTGMCWRGAQGSAWNNEYALGWWPIPC